MKNLFSTLLLIGLMSFVVSCDSDDDTPTPTPTPPSDFDLPTVTISQDGGSLSEGASGTATFSVSVDSELTGNWTASKTGDITLASASGSVSGNSVDVDFTVGSSAGAASITLTVTDSDNKTASATVIYTVVAEEQVILISESISSDQTWESGKTYILGGRIFVLPGATLTIESGVVVKGEAGSGANATALIVARNGKLRAMGTASAPIIFTSVADEIQPGQIASPNLDPDLDGLWGGLLVLGNAPSSFRGDVQAFQIEGIPASDTNGLYGGNDAADDSGEIHYISIRHGGSNIGEGNEINGLTLGGVGTGTTIDHVEVIANQDDGIEWFGGTVNVTHALVWNSGDDALDTDQAWAGTMDNFILICGSNTDHALEIDGPEGSFLDGHNVKNGSVKGHPASEFGDFRDGAIGVFENIYFFNFTDPATNGGRGDFSLSGDKTLATFAAGDLAFDNLEVTPPAGVALSTIFRNGTDVFASEVAAGANTVGADKSAFAGWTWADVEGELSDFN